MTKEFEELEGDKTKEHFIGFDLERLGFDFTPDNFKRGLQTLADMEFKNNVPYLFQTFIEVFGGFYDDSSDDLKTLSEISGVPESLIVEYLTLFDVFFPMSGRNWMHKIGNLNFIKFVPGFIRGVGCFFRRSLYKIDQYSEYSDKNWMLTSWHNALYHSLEKKLGVKEDKPT